jgi:hypothetical protein
MPCQKGHGLQGSTDFVADDILFTGLVGQGVVLATKQFRLNVQTEKSLDCQQGLLFSASPSFFRIDLQNFHKSSSVSLHG